MAMTDAQRTAFETSAGSTSLVSFNLWVGIALTIVLLWSTWALVVAYRGWADGNLSAGAFGWAIVRVTTLILMLMFFTLS